MCISLQQGTSCLELLYHSEASKPNSFLMQTRPVSVLAPAILLPSPTAPEAVKILDSSLLDNLSFWRFSLLTRNQSGLLTWSNSYFTRYRDFMLIEEFGKWGGLFLILFSFTRFLQVIQWLSVPISQFSRLGNITFKFCKLFKSISSSLLC